ncbi:DUF1294 domain-containing protein [Kiloniella antarctica]|uniref:DUF1294 domain-containing protein n=1 Tax=Kiloniella antarctica TaxID=1550907 RepID=A0ABW5BHP5_9PROT
MLFGNYDIAFIATAYICCVSVFSYLCFAWDKRCSIRGEWRISESTLLLIALAGGSIGSVIGQYVLRHKTCKQPFKFYLHCVVVLQLVLVLSLCFEEGLPFIRQLFISV